MIVAWMDNHFHIERWGVNIDQYPNFDVSVVKPPTSYGMNE